MKKFTKEKYIYLLNAYFGWNTSNLYHLQHNELKILYNTLRKKDKLITKLEEKINYLNNEPSNYLDD